MKLVNMSAGRDETVASGKQSANAKSNNDDATMDDRSLANSSCENKSGSLSKNDKQLK